MTLHRHFPANALLALALVPTLVLAPGCGGTAARPVEKTMDQTSRLVSAYESLSGRTDGVVTALEGLRGSVESEGILQRERVATGDIEKGYKSVKSAISDLMKATKEVESARSGLKSSVERQLKKWDADLATFESEDLRRAMLTRRTLTAERFTALSNELDRADLMSAQYVIEVSAIERALGHDLTPEGVGALGSVLLDAESHATPVTNAVQRAVAAAHEYVSTLSASGDA